MPTFAAIKIHYDHRASLAAHLKYSTLPSLDEYNEYLALFQEQGIGGNGFHECLNFSIPQSEPVRFYLPPTCIPAKSKMGNDFVFFSFTYKGDQALSAHVVGIHAGAQLLCLEPAGLPRPESSRIEGIEPLHYHAEAPAELVTLLTPPLPYENREGVYTPAYQTWGYGLRYIEQEHASNIVAASLATTKLALPNASTSQATVILRQIEVLTRIAEKYGLRVSADKSAWRNASRGATGGLPDAEVGYAGERLIYEREIAYVQSINRSPSEVEWISQSVPTSPYDLGFNRSMQQVG